MLSPLFLSLRVATVALVFALPFGIFCAYRLSRSRPGFWRTLIETLLTLPLVLPPSAVGVGLLLLFGRGSAWGRWLNDTLHLQILFTWQGAAVASAVVALPLIIRTVEAGLSSTDRDLTDSARTEGATEWQTFHRILFPLAYRSIFAGTVLGFARAFSEFGATLLIAGSIPSETETLPLALYAAIERGDDTEAGKLALLAVAVSFVLLLIANQFAGRIATARGDAKP
ncbi:MAG: molybdate ABC transporter permease subunit [Fibrella sp.]|nr:molybdate ABC transporter permease subunit [Armatimonadota bacterium]